MTGIVETALYVGDLECSGRSYEEIFGFRLLMSGDRMRAYSVADKEARRAARQARRAAHGIYDFAG